MKNKLKILLGLVIVIALVLVLTGCTSGNSEKESTTNKSNGSSSDSSDSSTADEVALTGDVNVVYLHHSTGENIWNGGVSSYVENYNSENNKNYQITELAFPSEEYGYPNLIRLTSP